MVRSVGSPAPIFAARAVGVALAIAMAAAGACREETPDEVALDTGGTAAIDHGECEPGAELPCTCASGSPGTQICLESGFERTGCICEGPPPTPPADTGPTTTSDGGSTSSGSTGGGTTTGGSSSSSGPSLDSSGGG